MNLWRRFRALPGSAQAAAWVGLAAVYTVALVLILGGGDSDDGGAGQPVAGAEGKPAKPLDPKERKVAEKVEGVKVKVAEQNDVPEFRRPDVQSVECKDGRCTIEYTSGLPGRGRIFEDQQQMLAEIFADDEVDEVVMRVYRAGAVGRDTPAKANEETMPGSPILITECKRTGEPRRADAGDKAKVPPVPADCRSLPLSQGPNQANNDAPRENRDPQGEGGTGILGDG